MVTRWKLPGRIGGRSRIDGAVPARKVEGQDTTPRPVSVEQDFAGEEPEAVEEDLTGGESGLSAEDRPDGLAELGTTRGLEHQVKIDQFQAFISRLYGKRLRDLDLQELHAVSSPVKTPSSRSAVELSKEDQVSDALSRENLVPLGAKTPLSMLHRATFQFWVVWNSMPASSDNSRGTSCTGNAGTRDLPSRCSGQDCSSHR